MKKIISTLIIFAGIYSAAFAQTTGRTEFGFNIGLNSSTVEYSGTNENSSYTSGFNIGATGEYYFSDRWSFKARVSYDQKGWGNGYLILNDGTEIDGIDYHVNYVTVPLLASWHFGRMRNWYLHFGPYVGFLTSASETSNSADVKPLFNSTDVGFDLGLGVKIPISNKANLFFEYDGQGGGTNIFKESDGGSYQNIRSSLNVGLSFPMK